MRYADNQPCKECRDCLEYAERQHCRNCEGRTLQMFIRWTSVAMIVMVIVFGLALKAKGDVTVMETEAFTVGFDFSRKQPAWAQYDLEADEVIETSRHDYAFSADPHILTSDMRPQYAALAKKGYDRGHLVPAADLNWDTNALRRSYYFSNVCPMAAKLNRGKWSANEREIRELAKRYGKVHVLVYPVYDDPKFTPLDPKGFFFPVPKRFVKVAWGKFGIRTWMEENR